MIESGTLLQNRYRVVKQIGQGGMGAVYVATDERFSSTVAVKQTFFDDPALRRAFEREAHLLNHLRHTALPKVSDHFTEGDGQFLVMEFIEGSDLSELLKERGGSAFPVADVLAWADALLDALDYLHTHEPQVIHRDIKPQNLKLTPRGQIVLLDFGLAKGNSTETRANLTASVFGYSRNYAPLEQIQGTGTDARSDLYSLAATLYHLLTGAAPVDALTRASAIINSQPDPLRPAHLAHAQVPAAVGEILRRAMSQNAAHRQASASEMRAALRRAASVLPVSARQTPSVFAQAKPATDMPTLLETPTPTNGQQHQSLATETRSMTQLRQPHHSATHQSETTIVDAAGYGAPRRRPSTNSFVPTPEPERKSKAVFVGVALALVAACALVAFPLMRRDTATVALPAASEAQAESPLSAPAGDAQQPSTSGASQTEATRTTSNASSASEMTSAPNGTRGASGAGDSQTANGQPANRESGATNNSDTSASGNNAGGAESNAASTPAGASASRSSGGLVLHAPAPSSTSNAAAEYDAQRAEELKRRQQQQQQQLQQQQQRPHPSPPDGEHFGPPPPGGGRRPPPRRPPPF